MSVTASKTTETMIIGGTECGILGICNAQHAGCTLTPCFKSKNKGLGGINSHISTERAIEK